MNTNSFFKNNPFSIQFWSTKRSYKHKMINFNINLPVILNSFKKSQSEFYPQKSSLHYTTFQLNRERVTIYILCCHSLSELNSNVYTSMSSMMDTHPLSPNLLIISTWNHIFNRHWQYKRFWQKKCPWSKKHWKGGKSIEANQTTKLRLDFDYSGK